MVTVEALHYLTCVMATAEPTHVTMPTLYTGGISFLQLKLSDNNTWGDEMRMGQCQRNSPKQFPWEKSKSVISSNLNISSRKSSFTAMVPSVGNDYKTVKNVFSNVWTWTFQKLSSSGHFLTNYVLTTSLKSKYTLNFCRPFLPVYFKNATEEQG